MAFPADYSKYQVVTIQSTEVDADLTDFPIYIDLSDMDTTTDIFGTCRSDGGDIRVTKSDGTTQLPVEVVTIDTTAKTGEMHVQYTGTLSSSSNTDIWVWYNGTDTEPAADSTYGSEAVWDDYTAVIHMQEDPNSDTSNAIKDSTSNDNHATTVGTMTSADNVSGQLAGYGLDLDGSNDYMYLSDSTSLGSIFDSYSTAWCMSWWVKTASSGNLGGAKWDKFGTVGWGTFGGGSGDQFYVQPRYSASNEDRIATSEDDQLDDGNWNLVRYQNTTSTTATDYEFYKNATQQTTTQTENGLTTQDISNSTQLNIGEGDQPVQYATTYDELRIRAGNYTSTWISTEHSNQSAASSFYSVGAEQGGAATFTPKVMMY